MKLEFPLARLFSIMVIGVAVQAVCGHLLGRREWYDWNHSGVGMSINTAVCLILLAGAVFYLAIEKANR